MKTRHHHVAELQSIRGLAALVVLLHHSSSVFPLSPTFQLWTERLLNAHAAVMLFFVLSGYVLSRSLSGRVMNANSLFKFYFARVFRIYPALVAACLFASVYMLAIRPHLPVTGASPWYVTNAATPRLAVMLSTFTGRPTSLLPPMWSIRVELMASVVIPFIAVLVRRNLGFWILAISLIAGWEVQASFGTIFLPSFVIGSLAFHLQGKCGRLLRSPIVLWLSLFIMMFFRTLSPHWRFEVAYNAFVPLVVESVFAAILIVGLVERRSHLLQARDVTRLGDISYSMYLLHFTVMSIIAGVLSLTPLTVEWKCILLMISTVGVTWPLSAISYDLIELGGIALGKKLYSRIKRAGEAG